jgi:hypothetical protein
LNLDFPEDNEGGVWAQYVSDVVSEKRMYNVIAIQKPCYDVRDYELGMISAELLDDGSGVIITEPSAPHFMINKIEKIYGKDDKKDEMFFKMSRLHATAANAIRKEPSRYKKQTIHTFPGNYCGKMGVFNNNSGQKLKTFIRLANGTILPFDETKIRSGNGSIKQTLNFRCIWLVVLDEEERVVEEETGGAVDENWIDAFQSMSTEDN